MEGFQLQKKVKKNTRADISVPQTTNPIKRSSTRGPQEEASARSGCRAQGMAHSKNDKVALAAEEGTKKRRSVRKMVPVPLGPPRPTEVSLTKIPHNQGKKARPKQRGGEGM